MSKTHIISDLHLSLDRVVLTALFTKYMNEIAIESKTLYVLGDLFEVWIGDDCLNQSPETKLLESTVFYQSIVKQFKNYSDHIGELFFIHGNRDFLLGTEFEKQTGGKLLAEPYFCNLNGKKSALMHGDSLCTDDIEYQKFRAMVRNPAWQKELLSLPKEKRFEIAQGMREQSKDAQKEKTMDIMDVNQDSVISFFTEYDIEQLIHGHTHRQKTHQLTIANKAVKRVVLSDWGTQGFYLELNEQTITENYFS
ncbi:MAG: UDP-2,3-diacylglucosamine diphosphatase [Kangiellaceae bacterium]